MTNEINIIIVYIDLIVLIVYILFNLTFKYINDRVDIL